MLSMFKSVGGHPGGAVALLDLAAIGQGVTPVEDADVIEPEETAFEDIVTGLVDAVSPPRVAHEQFVEGLFFRNSRSPVPLMPRSMV